MIYLDHAAATPVNSKALAAMLPYFSEDFFNPSAPYLPAKHVREAYEQAKDQLAHVIGAKGVDLVITSGATESINLAFTVLQGQSSVSAITSTSHSSNPGKSSEHSSTPSRVLVLATEHAAVLEAAKKYSHTLIKVNRDGLIDLVDFQSKLTDDVSLVSISLVNNELGTIQPFAQISDLIRTARQDRLRRGITAPLYLHSDASQALSLLDLNVSRLGVDLLTINAAKCGGPKGVGALYVGHGVKLSPISVGGGQERGLRSGTENVPGVIGFAVAAVEAKRHLTNNRKNYQKMTEIIRQELTKITTAAVNPTPDTLSIAHISKNVNHSSKASSSSGATSTSNSTINPIPEPIFLGNPKHRLASFCPVCFPGLDAERLIYRLEQQEIYLSTGAACAANKGSKSHVLSVIGLTDVEIAGSLRISLGSTNTIEQIHVAAQAIASTVIAEYRRLARKI